MRTTLRPCVCRRALSPLLGGPFLMSPRRRQSATAGPAPAGPRHQVGRTGWAAGHGYLRGSYEARSPPGAFLRKPPAGLLATGFRVFLLTEYPYDPLVRRPTPSLDSRRPPDCFSSGYCDRLAHTAPGWPGPVCTVSHSYPRGLMLRHRWRLAAY